MRIVKHIPNTITCGNLFCGCLAIVKAFEGDLVWSAYLVGIATVLDFFDGFAARMLKVTSPIGKDLDSLADMVTFGVVPGVVLFTLIDRGIGELLVDGPAEQGWTIYPPSFSSLPYVAFIVTIFSAIRLAKFNNDTRQTDSFIGVPTPANSIFICSLPLVLSTHGDQFRFILHPVLLVVLACISSFLLVSELPLFALKFKNLGWQGNRLRYCFLAISIILMISIGYPGIPLVIILYILVSIVNNIFSKKKV